MPTFRQTVFFVFFVTVLSTAVWVWDRNSSSHEEVDQDLLRMGGSGYMNMDLIDAPFYEQNFYSVRKHLADGRGLDARPSALRLIDSLRELELAERLPEANELLRQAGTAVESMSDDEVWKVVEQSRRSGFNDIAKPDLIGSSYEAFLRSQRSGDLKRASIALRHICVELTKFARDTQSNLEPINSSANSPALSASDYDYYIELARRDRLKAISYCTRAFDANESIFRERSGHTITKRLKDIQSALTQLFKWNDEPERADEYDRRIDALL